MSPHQRATANEATGGPIALDGVTVRILWDRLVSIVDQASLTHVRTAFSTIVRESNDYAASLLTTSGETLANSQYGLPSFVATQAFTLQHLHTLFDKDEFEPGDVLISNDPWIGTGQAMDITLLAPLFCGQHLVAFAGSVAHSPDLGGAQRWNVSHDVFEEAVRIPHLKLVRGGVINETLVEVIRCNSRLPDLTIGDLEAQLASLGVMRAGVAEMMEEYELTDLDQLAEEITDRSEEMMRRAISEIPDGTYVHEVWSDGFTRDRASAASRQPVAVRATVTKAGAQLKVDFTGSSPQVDGSFNGVWTMSTAYASYALRMILVPHLPNNGGFYRPLEVICPAGTVVNARFPAATLCRHVLAHQVCDAVFGALAEVLPERVMAASGSTPIWDLLLMGHNDRGEPFHRLLCINGGSGATEGRDGCTIGFPANLSNTPIEVMEATLPLIWECKEAIPDSGGAGRYRGGLGQRMRARATTDIDFALINDRVEHPPLGLLGGRPGRPGRLEVGGDELPACSDGTLRAGATLTVETPEGAGLGAPQTRSTEAVEEDVVEGLVSASTARVVYGRSTASSRSVG